MTLQSRKVVSSAKTRRRQVRLARRGTLQPHSLVLVSTSISRNLSTLSSLSHLLLPSKTTGSRSVLTCPKKKAESKRRTTNLQTKSLTFAHPSARRYFYLSAQDLPDLVSHCFIDIFKTLVSAIGCKNTLQVFQYESPHISKHRLSPVNTSSAHSSSWCRYTAFVLLDCSQSENGELHIFHACCSWLYPLFSWEHFSQGISIPCFSRYSQGY